MPSKIAIFCGNGGVGKTTVSLALALKYAAAGRRVLVVTSHPLNELAVAVSLEGLSAKYPAAVKNLFVVHLDAQELLRDVVNRTFPVSAAADEMVRSAIFRNLVEAAPGLKAFYFLARLQELAQREAAHEGPGEATPQYELLIWDAPSSGHFLSTLRSARIFDYSFSGPLAKAGADVARFFSHAQELMVVPVTTLEQRAVDATVELTDTLNRDFQIKGTSVVLNLTTPFAAADGAGSDDPVLQFVFERGRMERERANWLGTKLGLPAVAVPRLSHSGSDLAMLGQIAGILEFPATA